MKLIPVTALLAVALMLSACGVEPEPTPTPTPTESASPTPTRTPTPTPTPTPTVVSGWKECPGIVKRLNATAPDGTTYVEIEWEKFGVIAVGSDVLARACVVDVVVSGEPVTWAILPGDQVVADNIARELLGDGFIAKDGGVYVNNDTGFGVLVRFSGTGATLDSSLKLTSVFKPFVQPLVYLATFTVS